MTLIGRTSLLCGVTGMLLIAGMGCSSVTTETRETTEISFAPRDLQKISISVIYRDKKRVGDVEEYRQVDGDNDDANDRTLWIVLDTDGQRLGYITDDHRAYRFQAHGPSEMVANHPKLANDVMAIFGWYEGTVDMERQVVKD